MAEENLAARLGSLPPQNPFSQPVSVANDAPTNEPVISVAPQPDASALP
jgi:hypothetical protein